MRVLGSFRRSILLLSTVVVLALIAIGGALQASGAGRSPEDPMERRVLRLHDMPPGYFPLSTKLTLSGRHATIYTGHVEGSTR